MIVHWLILILSLLFLNIRADGNQTQHLRLTVAEHQVNAKDSPEQPSSEKTLIRVPRMDNYVEELTGNIRQRRDAVRYNTDDIWGMAKAVAITVFVLISVTVVCCFVTAIYICLRCCRGTDGNRKRNQGFNTMPQPIIIHTNSPPYQQQYYQQQAAAASPPVPTASTAAQPWLLENYPMLPEPSAPPHPIDESQMERPPPYEKICAT